MRFIGITYGYYIFFNGEYYFELSNEWIVNGFYSHSYFTVNQKMFIPDNDKHKYEQQTITLEEINKQIELVRMEYPEFLL